MTRSKTSASTILLAGAIVVIAAGVTWLAVRPVPSASLADRTRAVAATLRCPECENLSVADSPSALAGEIRREISDMLRAGRTPDQIRDVFVGRYGESILLAPPASGVTLLAWVIPVAAFAAGLAGAVLVVRRWTRGRSGREVAGPTDDEDRLSADDRQLLAAALDEQDAAESR
jgi:cytochrome c-type biogenesis protein CcmH